MKAARAYLAVLGITGLLTATVVVLLVIGSGFAAFDEPSDVDGTTNPLERIVVEEDAESALDSARTRWSAGGRVDRTSPLAAAADRRPFVSGKGVVPAGARGVGNRLGGGAVAEVGAPGGSTGGGAAADGGSAGGGDGGGGGTASGGGGSHAPPPVRDTVGGALEGATGVIGGTID